MHTPIPRAAIPRLPHPDLQPLGHVRRLLLPRESEAMRNQKIMIGVIVGVAIFVFLAVLIFILNKYHGSIRLSRRRGSRSRYGSYYRTSWYGGGSSRGSQTSSEKRHGAPPPPPPPPPV